MEETNKNSWVCVQCKAKNPISVSECQKCGFSFEQILENAKKVREPVPWFRIVGLAIIVVGLMIMVKPWFFSAREPKNSLAGIARDRMRVLADAIEAYRARTGRYVVAATEDEGVNAALSIFDPARRVWTFLAYQPDGPMTLTTPVPFIKSYPHDPFSKRGKGVFGYYNDREKGYILFSPGPDRDYDIEADQDYDALARDPVQNLLDLTFDPTNGAQSDGDIWIVKK